MIYILIAFLLLFLSFYYDFANKKSYSSFWWIFMYWLLVAVAGLRYKVGSDTFAYEAFFEEENLYISTLALEDYFNFNWEPLFIFFIALIKSTIDSFVFFQICHALIINGIIFWFIRTNTRNKFTTLFFYFLFLYLLLNMEMAREALAVCVFLIDVKYLCQKKWLKYYLIALIAFFFHYGAAILFLFPFLYTIKLSSKNVILILALSIVIIGIIVFGDIFTILSNIGIPAIIVVKMAKYIYLSDGLNIVGMIISLIGYVFFPLAIINVYQKYVNKDPRFSGFYFIFFVLALVVIILPFLSRFYNYICLIALVYLSNFLVALWQSKRFTLISKLIIIPLIFVATISWNGRYYLNDISDITGKVGMKKYLYWYPYSSVFDKKINTDRERLRDYME